MTLDEFVEVGRIPTPAEFLGFATARGWGVAKRADGTASLRVPDPRDEMAVAFARMLSCEPFRTNVLALVESGTDPNPAPTPATPPEPAWDQTAALRAMEQADQAVESSGVSGSEVMAEAKAVAEAYYRRDGAGFRAALAELSRAIESRRGSSCAASSASSITGSPGSG